MNVIDNFKPYEGSEPYIFISYAHADDDRVLPVVEDLYRRGYKVWYDEGIEVGSEWQECIAAHLMQAKLVIAFISNAYIKSDNCRREMHYALTKKIKTINVFLEETELSPGMEMQIGNIFALMKYTFPSEEYFYEKLYEIIDTINAEYGVNLQKATLEPIYRAEVARLFDSELEVIPGAQALLDAVSVPMCVVSNGPVSKMQHSLGRTGLLRHFTDRLYSGYDIQRWKPDPALMFHAAEAMQVKAENCILVDDSSAGAQSGIAAGMEVFYFCADPHNQPIDHPKVTTFTDLAELPALWQARGWDITR